MPLSSIEILVIVVACALLGIVVFIALRWHDRAQDRPALVALLAWARGEGLVLTRVRKCRGEAGRLGQLPRQYSVTVAGASGGVRHALITFRPTFMGIDPESLTLAWDTTAPDALIGAEDLPLPSNP